MNRTLETKRVHLFDIADPSQNAARVVDLPGIVELAPIDPAGPAKSVRLTCPGRFVLIRQIDDQRHFLNAFRL